MLSKVITVIVFLGAAVSAGMTIQEKAYKKITAELLKDREHQKMIEEKRAKDCDRTKQKKL